MSDTETEAVEAGARAVYESDEVFVPWESAGEDYAATYRQDAKTAYDAMREIIAREAIAGVCCREGHDANEVTSYGDLDFRFICGRCSAAWSEPRPDTTGRPVHVGQGSLPITVSIDGINKHPGWFEAATDGLVTEWCIEMRAATGEQHRGQRIPVEFWRGEISFQGEVIVSAWRADSDGTARTVLTGIGNIERVEGGDRAQG